MKIQLTAAKAIDLLNALSEIAKGEPNIIETNGVKSVVYKPFKLDGVTALRIKMNIKALSPLAQSFDEARGEAIQRLSNGGTSLTAAENPKEFAEYQALVRQMLKDGHEVELVKIDEEKLVAHDNMIPITALMLLIPILNEMKIED